MTDQNEARQTSDARINANRENAKKSTGPRSDAGKAASSRNRLIHGLRANKHILLGDDNPEDFLLLLQDLHNTFRPVGEGEEMLVAHIAADMWRLEHSLPMEAALFRHRLQGVAAADYHRKRELANQKINHEREPQTYSPAPDPPDPDDRLARAFMIDCDKPNHLASLARYKAAAQLSIDRNLRQLKIFQTARIANTPGPPDQPSGTSEDPVGQALSPANPDATPTEPAATPPKSADYHSNPTNGGIAKFSATAMFLVALIFMHAASPGASSPNTVHVRGADHRLSGPAAFINSRKSAPATPPQLAAPSTEIGALPPAYGTPHPPPAAAAAPHTAR
jgi:hypothetical protein